MIYIYGLCWSLYTKRGCRTINLSVFCMFHQSPCLFVYLFFCLFVCFFTHILDSLFQHHVFFLIQLQGLRGVMVRLRRINDLLDFKSLRQHLFSIMASKDDISIQFVTHPEEHWYVSSPSTFIIFGNLAHTCQHPVSQSGM